MSTPETNPIPTIPITLEDVETYKQESLNSLVSTFADLPLDTIVTRSLNNGFTKAQISNAIKEYIDGRD